MATLARGIFRSVETAPREVRRADKDDALAELMHEVGSALRADALVVAWHERDGTCPELLFTEGVKEESQAAERASVEGGTLCPDLPGPSYPCEWRCGEGDAEGGEFTTSIATAAGVVVITGRFNRLGNATRQRVRDTTARLLPMVRPFVSLWAARRAMLSRLRGLTAALNKSDVGILLVNSRGQLLFSNAAARATIAENDGIHLQGKMVTGSRLAETLQLHATIEHVIGSSANSSRHQRAPVVSLARKMRRPLLAAILASEDDREEACEKMAIIYLCDPDQDMTALVEPTCKLYGLSPVETRLACLLARGLSLTDAAEAMRVREQTARSYLKQIFLKTETRRQAELVWLMLKSSVRTNDSYN